MYLSLFIMQLLRDGKHNIIITNKNDISIKEA